MTPRRRVIKGLSISSGIAMGQVRLVHPGYLNVAEMAISAGRVKAEIAALDKAVRDTTAELEELRDAAGKKMGGPVTKIFDAQLLIAADESFLSQVRQQISTRLRNAGFVYNALIRETILPMELSPDAYMQNMAHEIEAVASRVLSHLSGFGEKSTARFRIDTVPVATTFSPGDILSFRNRKALGFVASEGGADSHMGLIARSLMMPMVVTGNLPGSLRSQDKIIVDGTRGLVILNPNEDDWSDYQKLRKRQGPAAITRIKKLTEIPPTTADGIEISVACNLEFPGPADEILSEKKIPVGLYRTEFLYLERDGFPSEEAQFEYYSKIAEKFSNSHTVFRTFDLGSDKVSRDGLIPKEDNPALGWRGIRSMLEMAGIFKSQVRAILRASVAGEIRVLLPMISDLSELKKAKKLISQVMLGLRRDNISYDEKIKIGIMVEVPSAALMADLLVQHVDFVSIGTNDLTQYTMSADRSNSRVSGLYNPYHPAVLRLILDTVRACQKHGKKVYICGEVAGDPLALPLFIGMGVNGLSMNPAKIFDCCRLIKRIDSEMTRHIVKAIIDSKSASAVVKKLQSYRNALDKK